jgi:hypothetical protein
VAGGPGAPRLASAGPGQVAGTGVEVQHPIDVIHFADALIQAEAQPAGLQILLTPLKTHTAKGIKGAGVGVELDPIGQQAPPANQGSHRAGAHKALQLIVEFLAIGFDLQLQGGSRHQCRRRRRRVRGWGRTGSRAGSWGGGRGGAGGRGGSRGGAGAARGGRWRWRWRGHRARCFCRTRRLDRSRSRSRRVRGQGLGDFQVDRCFRPARRQRGWFRRKRLRGGRLVGRAITDGGLCRNAANRLLFRHQMFSDRTPSRDDLCAGNLCAGNLCTGSLFTVNPCAGNLCGDCLRGGLGGRL